MFTKKPAKLFRLTGAEIIKISAADVKTEDTIVFQLCFLTNKKTIRGANAMLCGLASTAAVNAATDSFGFESRMSMSDDTRKNVYIASNCPQIDPLKIVAGLNAYNAVAMSEESKLKRFLRKTNIRPAVAVSKRVEGSFKIQTREDDPKSESHLAKEPKAQKM
jgi:hypothetical protein